MNGIESGNASLPLKGLKVVEFCSVAAGPFCGMLLADMGADVVKVEPPSGDTLRHWPPMTGGFSENFASLNRNKRSIALDLKAPADQAIARRLIGGADVVIENNRAGAMVRLGLGYQAFADRRRLIYCSMSAFGQDGPRSAEGGFDLTIQAISGIMSVTGDADGSAVKCGVPISDFATGLYAAFSIAALASRVRAGGPGGYIDISMQASSLAIAALQTSEYFGTGINPRRLGTAHPRNAPYQGFSARDGQFVMAAGNDRLWRGVCHVVGRPELIDSPRFRTTSDRARNQIELAGILNAAFAEREVADLLAEFAAAGVPSAPMNSYAEALADPQVEHMGFVKEMELPDGATIQTFASAVRIDGSTASIRTGPPALDGDREAILRELDESEAASPSP